MISFNTNSKNIDFRDLEVDSVFIFAILICSKHFQGFKLKFNNLIKVIVMIQLSHQQLSAFANNSIQHLNYENKLLTDRNLLLSQENQRLLQQLSRSSEIIRQYQEINACKTLHQLQPLMKIAQEQLVQSLGDLGPEFQSKIKVPLFWLKKQIKQANQQDVVGFVQNLLRIIKKLSESFLETKQLQSKKRLKQSEERLIARKTARDRTEKYIHVVKEPNQLLNGNNIKHLTQQIAQQRQFFEKLIRKVKKDSVSMKLLSNIYEQLDHTTSIRNALKNEQAKLSIFQRQIQLGFIQSTSLSETIQRIEELKNQLNCSKRKLQDCLQLV